jgi:hypothetical protein
MKKILGILILLGILPLISVAQKLEYGLEFDGIGDNREYFSGYNQPETILGSRIGFDLGTRIDSIHQIRVGLSYFYEFGSELLELKPQPILYYSVEMGPLLFKFGAFMRNQTIHFPLAMLSDKYEYYNPTVDGLYLKYQKSTWQTSLFVDWVGRQDSVRHEQFMAGLSANAHPGNFIFDGYWYMFHNAGNMARTETDHIKDYMGACVMAGYDFSKLIPHSILTIKTGALISLFRDRGVEGLDYVPKYSSYSEIETAYKGYGVKTILNFGDPHSFSHGDDFFNNTTRYIRTDLYFTPINFKRVKGRFTWSFHWANSEMDNQQLFSLIYIFNPL